MKIYVASSWRNVLQQGVVHLLRAAGHEVYDFRRPAGPGSAGFSWRDLDPEWERWTPAAYRDGLRHPVARDGFARDWSAMRAADAGVLVLPCGRSAHIEAGYFVGAGKPLYVLMAEPQEPELMYAMAAAVCLSTDELLRLVGMPSQGEPPARVPEAEFGPPRVGKL
jgi:hypothetical protein